MSGKVAAILLAAGKSRRMGCCKQLLPLGKTTVIGRCLTTILEAGLREIVVVVPAGMHELVAEIEHYAVRIVINHDAAGDMASSVRAGRDALSQDVNAALVALCDYPLVLPGTIADLVRFHLQQPGQILIPGMLGRRGHPLLFPMEILKQLTADLILRDLVRSFHDRVSQLEVQDTGILIDMDTPEDYQQILQMAGNRPNE